MHSSDSRYDIRKIDLLLSFKPNSVAEFSTHQKMNYSLWTVKRERTVAGVRNTPCSTSVLNFCKPNY